MLGLSPTQEILFATLQQGERRIIDLMYALWKGGGPEAAHKALYSHIYGLNKRLRPHGFEVRCRRFRIKNEWQQSVYFLRQLTPAQVCPWKALDRDGLYIG